MANSDTQTTAADQAAEEREKSIENSQFELTTEFKSTSATSSAAESNEIGGDEEEVLSRIESATSAAYDPASRVPTNVSLDTGIVGKSLPPLFFLRPWQRIGNVACLVRWGG
jgi:hypothetical protein